MRVILVTNYPADRVESMHRFGQLMAGELEKLGIDVDMLAPSVRWGRMLGSYRYSGIRKWLGYVDKHVVFSRQLARAVNKAELRAPSVAHVVDHGNAIYVPRRRNLAWIVTCHDLFTVRAMRGESTGISPSLTGRWQQRWIAAGLGRADHVVCDSRSTHDDFLRLFPRKPGTESSVIPVALNHKYARIPAEIARMRLEAAGLGRLSAAPFVLHVGSNQPRKNRQAVLRVAAAMRGETAVSVVLAGQEPDAELKRVAEAAGVAGRLTSVVRPDNDLLEALYNVAHALLFPSYFEGFGWPIAEAQACGCPVVCSNTSSVPEVSGGAAFLHEPDDVAGMADSLRKLFEPAVRAGLVEGGLRNARRFEPAEMARAYAQCYSDAAKRFPGPR